MTIATQMLQAAMPELRTRYAVRLKSQSSELLDFISRCERGKLSDEACADARLLAHSLCGSGKTFGFPETSAAARSPEPATDCGPPHNPQNYIELALRLIRACDPAIQSVEMPDAPPPIVVEEPTPRDVEQPMMLCMSDN